MTVKTGCELDILIAEKVMGWKLKCYESDVYATEPGQYDDAMKNDGWFWENDPVNEEAWEFKPSTEIAIAWCVVEKLIRNGFTFSMGSPDALGPEWRARFAKRGTVDHPTLGATKAKSGAHAICLAALKAVGA